MTFASLMAGISIAVERAVEMIKGAVPLLANPWPKNDQLRAAIVQLIAAALGAVVVSQMPGQIKSAMPAQISVSLNWTTYVVLGLMASGGSGAWNHVLDILAALKTRQETLANLVQATGSTSGGAPLPAPRGTTVIAAPSGAAAAQAGRQRRLPRRSFPRQPQASDLSAPYPHRRRERSDAWSRARFPRRLGRCDFRWECGRTFAARLARAESGPRGAANCSHGSRAGDGCNQERCPNLSWPSCRGWRCGQAGGNAGSAPAESARLRPAHRRWSVWPENEGGSRAVSDQPTTLACP